MYKIGILYASIYRMRFTSSTLCSLKRLLGNLTTMGRRQVAWPLGWKGYLSVDGMKIDMIELSI